MPEVGLIPHPLLAEMIQAGFIHSTDSKNLTQTSLNLQLSEQAFRLRASSLPKSNESIEQFIEKYALYPHNLQQPLEPQTPYLIRLTTSLKLPPGIRAKGLPMQDASLIDLELHLLADKTTTPDIIPGGYQGSLWLEVISNSFPLLLQPGNTLYTLRFFHGEARLNRQEHKALNQDLTLPAYSLPTGFILSLGLSQKSLIGWHTLHTSNILDLSKTDQSPFDFFEPITPSEQGDLFLKKNSFTLLTISEMPPKSPQHVSEIFVIDEQKHLLHSPSKIFELPNTTFAIKTHRDIILRDQQPLLRLSYERILNDPRLQKEKHASSSSFKEPSPSTLPRWFKK